MKTLLLLISMLSLSACESGEIYRDYKTELKPDLMNIKQDFLTACMKDTSTSNEYGSNEACKKKRIEVLKHQYSH